MHWAFSEVTIPISWCVTSAMYWSMEAKMIRLFVASSDRRWLWGLELGGKRIAVNRLHVMIARRVASTEGVVAPGEIQLREKPGGSFASRQDSSNQRAARPPSSGGSHTLGSRRQHLHQSTRAERLERSNGKDFPRRREVRSHFGGMPLSSFFFLSDWKKEQNKINKKAWETAAMKRELTPGDRSSTVLSTHLTGKMVLKRVEEDVPVQTLWLRSDAWTPHAEQTWPSPLQLRGQ